MIINRIWAMPAGADTFNCKPIMNFVFKYLKNSKISIDPFARNKNLATYTNDLNPDTLAEYHMDAWDFLKYLHGLKIKADLVIFDPPYSPRQIKELYDGIGINMTQKDGQRSHSWKAERDIINSLLIKNGIVLSFGWDSMGMGKKRGFKIDEILLVCHGAGHNDTICMAESRIKTLL